MKQNLFQHVNIKVDHTYLPDGTPQDGEEECSRFNAVIEQQISKQLHCLMIRPLNQTDKLAHL